MIIPLRNIYRINLNKQSLYLAIANIILEQLNVLYNNLSEDSLKEKEGNTQIYNTQIIQLNSINVPQRNNLGIINLSIAFFFFKRIF
jgi:hypothetical protein